MINRVAVTGATGYVGRFVVAELQNQGVQVRALARAESDREGFAAPIEWVRGNLRSQATLAELVEGVGAVIHLAYEHLPGRYRGGEGSDLPAWLDSNLNGTLDLLMAAQKAGVGQFVFLSSRAVFSRTEMGRILDESHPTSPDTHYGAYKVAVEAFLQSFAHVYGMRTYAIRATGVYGVTWPVERSKWWGLILDVLRGEENLASGGGTEVHGADVARVIWSLITKSDRLSDVVHLSDLYVTHRQVVELTRGFANMPGALPPTPLMTPQNILVSTRLNELGLTLGGLPVLEETILSLVRYAEGTLKNA